MKMSLLNLNISVTLFRNGLMLHSKIPTYCLLSTCNYLVATFLATQIFIFENNKNRRKVFLCIKQETLAASQHLIEKIREENVCSGN